MASGFWIPRILQISLTVLINLNQRSRSHDPLWNPTFDGSDSYGDKIIVTQRCRSSQT
jgi:hypothetical protein